jgi:hypothetical protein
MPLKLFLLYFINSLLFATTCNDCLYGDQGTSITAGMGLTMAQRYGDVAIAPLINPPAYFNFGVGGAGCATLNSAASAPGGMDSLLPSYTGLEFMSIECGSNEIGLGGGTAAGTFSDFLGDLQARQAAGWTNIIVFTMIDRMGVNESIRAAYNALLIGGASTYGYTVADVGSDPNLGCNGCWSNTTYFQAIDGVHPTAAGQAVYATYLQVKLGLLGFTNIIMSISGNVSLSGNASVQ